MRLKKMFLLMLLSLTPFVIIPPLSNGTPSPTQVFLDPPRVTDTSLVPGVRFTINMSLDYVEPDLLWGYQLTMSFNPSVLHGVSVENGPFLENGGGTALVIPGPGFNNTAGTLGLFGTVLNPPENLPKGGSDEYGPLCAITFEVVGYGGSPITLGPETGLANHTKGGKTGWIIHKRENPEYFSDGYFDNRPPISVEPEKVLGVPASGSFTINVSVTEMPNLYSWEFYLNWSAPVLNVTSVVEGDFLTDGTIFYQEVHNDEGYIYANCTRTGSTGVTGNGTLAQITFLVERDMESTDLCLYETKLRDSTHGELPHGWMVNNGFFSNMKIHNIAVTSVTASPSMVKVGSGLPISINVTVKNTGAFSETFNVTIYYGEKEIDREADISLDSGENVTLLFSWDTTGVKMGVYGIKAVASVVAEEANINDNTRVYRSVIIGERNIGIVMGSASKSRVNIGGSVIISVLIENKGSLTENFNVTTYCNETVLKKVTVSDLDYAESVDITITWNTTGVQPGLYLIKAETSAIPEDVDTSDNMLKFAVIEIMVASTPSLPWETITLIAIVVVVASVGVITIVYKRMKKPPEEVF